jgi:RNA polymerase sigma factor (sigma-70 family)
MDKRVNILSSLSDAELAARAAQEKNYETFIEIERRYRQRVYWHVMKAVHDVLYAKDIVTRTFDAAKENIERGMYCEKYKLLNWLYGISHLLHTHDIREDKRHRTIKLPEETDVADDVSEAEEALTEKNKLRMIGRALHSCTRRERIAFILSVVKGKNWEHIGRRLGIKPESARKEAYRCRQHVCRLLEKRPS